MPRRPYWKEDETPETSAEARAELLKRVRAAKMQYVDLIMALDKLGIYTNHSELSKIFHGGREGPKVRKMLRIITELVEAKEGEAS